jgi:hypothetical protein
MEVIPEPAEGTAAILTGGDISFAGVDPYVIISGGGGDTDYICGACKVVLGKGVHRGMIQGLVLRCPSCKSYNTVRGT